MDKRIRRDLNEKINFKILIITSIVCLLPIILGGLYYNQLPESIAIHFDINNNPDGYFSKPAFIFGMLVIMLAIQVFCCIINDVKDKNPEANKKASNVFKWIIPILSIAMYSITIMYALGSSIDIRKIVMIMLGIMFIVIGNYTPKTKGSIYVKFRKVTNENIRKNIARISGYMLILNGILSIMSILFNQIVSVAVIILVIIEIFVLYIYAIIKDGRGEKI